MTHYYIHINTQNNFHKKVYIETPRMFYYDIHKIIKNFFFLSYIKNGPRKYYVL